MKSILWISVILAVLVVAVVGFTVGASTVASSGCQSKSQVHVADSKGNWKVNICGQVVRG